VTVEDLYQLREVHQRPAEAVDLVDHDHVDQPGLDVGDQLLERRPVQRAAGEAAVVVAVAERHPSLGALAGDVGLAGFALGVKAVELHVEPFLARLSGVDRAAQAADGFGLGAAHGRASAPWARPKNFHPFQ